MRVAEDGSRPVAVEICSFSPIHEGFVEEFAPILKKV